MKLTRICFLLIGSLITSSALSHDNDCEYLSLMKGIAVIQQDLSFQNWLMVTEKPEIFSEERRKHFYDKNKSRSQFTDLMTKLMEDSNC